MINRARVIDAFEAYVSDYDMSDDRIRLKSEHTYHVADNCEEIARSLSLSDADTDLAWLIGMLHDIGRFEQLRRYHTFVDAQSIDHAVFGADLLFGPDRLIRQFTDEGPDDAIVETAVRWHGAFEIPSNLSEREKLFAQIIRDADKIDIFRVVTEFSIATICDIPETELDDMEITDAVVEESLKHHTVLRSLRKTPLDMIIGHISLVYNMVYPHSFQMTLDQGNLKKLMGYRNRNEASNQKIRLTSDEVLNYINTKL